MVDEAEALAFVERCKGAMSEQEAQRAVKGFLSREQSRERFVLSPDGNALIDQQSGSSYGVDDVMRRLYNLTR